MKHTSWPVWSCPSCPLLLAAFVWASSIRFSASFRHEKETTDHLGSLGAHTQLGTLSADATESRAFHSEVLQHELQKKTLQKLMKEHIELEENPFKVFAKNVWHELRQIPKEWTHGSCMPVLFGVGMLTIFMCAIVDFRTGYRADPESESHGRSISDEQPTGLKTPERSIGVIVMLTSYKFYTGFLGATWVPFLIAKEGKSLIPHDAFLSTASFMGIAKMIYGFSIFLNPFFGLLSDRLASSAPWGGRSAFLLAGIGLSGIGIYAATIASDKHNIMWYLASSSLWMLGEAMADITSETIAPEMLPTSQYDLASSIRTMQHILGCVCAYVALIVAAAFDFHWRWLYVAYLSLMLLCALPTVACMRSLQDCNWVPRAGRSNRGPVLSSIFEAYIAPTRYAGGFPRACLCMTVFCLGTGPLFFTLLMLHDLVGLESEKTQQYHFSAISITFLIGAVITAVWSGQSQLSESEQILRRQSRPERDNEASCSASSDQEGHGEAAGPGDAGAGPSSSMRRASIQETSNRWTMMTLSILFFGVVCCIMPCVSFLRSKQDSLISFYVVSFLLGLAFGSVYSRFQACTWTLLPANVDIANAMGFAAVAKLTGIGIGNFVAGLILDGFRTTVDANGQNYSFIGYLVMNWSSALCVFASAALVHTIGKKRRSFSRFLK